MRPEKPPALDPQWSEPAVAGGRSVRKVTFTSFDGLRVQALYSLPEKRGSSKLPALLVVDDRRGIRVWGNEQPLEVKGEFKSQAVGRDLLAAIQPIPIVSAEKANELKNQSQNIGKDIADAEDRAPSKKEEAPEDDEPDTAPKKKGSKQKSKNEEPSEPGEPL